MEVAFIALVVVVLAILVGALLGFVSFSRVRILQNEISSLRSRLAQLEDKPVQDIAASGEQDAQPSDKSEPHYHSSVEPQTQDERGEHAVPEEQQPEPDLPIAAAVHADDSIGEQTAEKPGFEEALGGKWAVWVGGLALALGGVFLARYSIEQGLLGPAARLTLGFAFSFLLIGAGEWTRRRGAFFSIPGFEKSNVPATLTAAGTMGAFAAMYVAYAVLSFVGPLVGFAGMGIIAVAAMIAALLHGPALAALGLIGAYVAPFLVSTSSPTPWSLALYILLVSAAALTIARWRMWKWLAVTAGFGLALFTIVIATIDHSLTRLTLDGYLLIAVGLIAQSMLMSSYDADPLTEEPADKSATAIVAALILGSALLIQFDTATLLGVVEMLVVLLVGFGLSYFYSAARFLVIPSLIVVSLRMLDFQVPFSVYGGLVEGFGNEGPGAVVSFFAVDNVPSFVAASLILGGLSMALGFVGSKRSASRAQLAVGGTVLPVLLLVIAWMRVSSFTQSWTFFGAGVVLVGLLALFSQKLWVSDASDDEQHLNSPSTIFLTGSFSTLAIAVSAVLEKGFLTIALALVVPSIAYVHGKRPMPGLKQLALGLMAVWALRVWLDPAIVDTALGTTPIFNWLLYGWGLSALAFFLACMLFLRNSPDLMMDIIEGATITVTTLTIAILLIHAWDPAELFSTIDTLGETAFLVMTSGAVALGLLHARREQSRSVNRGIDLLGYGGMLLAGISLVVLFNPLFTGESMGRGLLFNTLSLAYLAPAVLYAVLGWVARDHRPKRYIVSAFSTAGLLGFTWISLSVRNFFSGPVLSRPGLPESELYTYSVVWLALGISILGAGILWKNSYLRIVSAGLIILVILKVFLVDMAGLEGILRAASFIVLGLVLVAVGLGYQRLMRRAPIEP